MYVASIVPIIIGVGVVAALTPSRPSRSIEEHILRGCHYDDQPQGQSHHVITKCYLPDGVYPSTYPGCTTEVELSGSPLHHVPEDAFAGKHLDFSLKDLKMSDCMLTTIHSHAFKSLNKLKNLDLSLNHIVGLTAGHFVGLKRLRFVNMTGNSVADECVNVRGDSEISKMGVRVECGIELPPSSSTLPTQRPSNPEVSVETTTPASAPAPEPSSPSISLTTSSTTPPTTSPTISLTTSPTTSLTTSPTTSLTTSPTPLAPTTNEPGNQTALVGKVIAEVVGFVVVLVIVAVLICKRDKVKDVLAGSPCCQSPSKERPQDGDVASSMMVFENDD